MNTPDQVISRAGVAQLQDYSQLEPMIDSLGFAVRRAYSIDTPIGTLRSQDGKPTLMSVIQFVVDPPKGGARISRVTAHVFFHDRWRSGRHTLPWLPEYDFNNPDCPSPDSVAGYRKVPRPLALDFLSEFIYDASDDHFYGEKGPTSGRQILDYVYEYHCRTLRRGFRYKWWLKQGLRSTVQRAVWRGQELLLWILREGYDIVIEGNPLRRSPFHKFRFVDFKRTTEQAKSHFFGFESSKRSLFSNLVILSAAFLVVYYCVPRFGFLKAIYHNVALTTAALIFVFFVSDQLVPALLKGSVCILSRLRARTVYMWNKVRA